MARTHQKQAQENIHQCRKLLVAIQDGRTDTKNIKSQKSRSDIQHAPQKPLRSTSLEGYSVLRLQPLPALPKYFRGGCLLTEIAKGRKKMNKLAVHYRTCFLSSSCFLSLFSIFNMQLTVPELLTFNAQRVIIQTLGQRTEQNQRCLIFCRTCVTKEK